MQLTHWKNGDFAGIWIVRQLKVEWIRKKICWQTWANRQKCMLILLLRMQDMSVGINRKNDQKWSCWQAMQHNMIYIWSQFNAGKNVEIRHLMSKNTHAFETALISVNGIQKWTYSFPTSDISWEYKFTRHKFYTPMCWQKLLGWIINQKIGEVSSGRCHNKRMVISVCMQLNMHVSFPTRQTWIKLKTDLCMIGEILEFYTCHHTPQGSR